MKRRNKLLVLFLMLGLSLYGCRRGQSLPTGAPTDAFIGGREGVVFEFEKDAPPPEVTDGAAFPFKAILNFENKGEFKVLKNQIRVRIVGFNPGDFSQTYSGIATGILVGRYEPKDVTNSDGYGFTIEQDLEPKTRTPEGEVIDGGITFLSFPSGGYFNAVQFPGNTEFSFKAEVCYKYQTKAVAKLCVLQNLIDSKPDALCNPNEGKEIYSSGSPVQITNFRQNVVGQDSIVLSFDVVHSGSGTIYKDQGTDADEGICPRDDSARRRSSLDKIHLIIKHNNLEVTNKCSVETGGFVRLIDGRRTVTCRLDLYGRRQADYESLVEIQADFNYDESKTTKVLVKHLPPRET